MGILRLSHVDITVPDLDLATAYYTGVMGMELKDEDYIEHLFVASTHDYLLFFTSVGKVYRLKVHELPLGSRQSKGRAISNLLPFRQDEYVRAVIATRDFEEARYLVFATKNGIVAMNCAGTWDDPILLSEVHFVTTDPKQNGLFFDIRPEDKDLPSRNRHFALRQCTFTGPGTKVRAHDGFFVDKSTLELPEDIRVVPGP
jgi:catechol 2,3-dioxygenase-like lactoylglutathione lyase family enzyme